MRSSCFSTLLSSCCGIVCELRSTRQFLSILFEEIHEQLHLQPDNSKPYKSLSFTSYLSPTGGSYTPGIVTDLIREVRDAGRVRDESLMNRVKALIEEKSWSHNETNMRVLRELEEVKVSETL